MERHSAGSRFQNADKPTPIKENEPKAGRLVGAHKIRISARQGLGQANLAVSHLLRKANMDFFCKHQWISRSGMDDGSICSKCHAISVRPVNSSGQLTGLATLWAEHFRKQQINRQEAPETYPPRAQFIHADSSAGASIMRGALSRDDVKNAPGVHASPSRHNL